MEQILYDSNEMVKVGCNNCEGCFECCCGMGESIILDPYDVYLLQKHLHCAFGELIESKIELNLVNGLILPNLKMLGEKERCGFLNEDGRCGIHAFRPGLCRLFPLGRNYEDGKLKYFILEDVCPKQNQMKVKIKKWLNVEELKKYEKFLADWHDFRKKLQKDIAQHAETDRIQKLNVQVLQTFYVQPYTEDNFYEQFEKRLKSWIF